jgi:hypothetical protein
MQNEFWCPLVGFEEQYEISNRSRVRSLHKRNLHNFLSVFIREGIACVQLSKNGKTGYYKLHRLLATTFIPNPKCKAYVIFLDGDSTNLSLENLAWADKVELCRLKKSKDSWETVVTLVRQTSDSRISNLLRSLNRDFQISRV